MKSVLLTGASGFIGQNLASALVCDFNLKQVFRNQPKIKPNSDYVLCKFENESFLSDVLKNVDVIVHCAGRAHLLTDNIINPLDAFRKVNVDLTLNLARQAVKSGVKRFIFLSSIGVNGRSNTSPFTEEDNPLPVQDYALSKLEAEQGLQDIASSSDMEVVIIRPPLVYGPGAPGNFAKLMKWMNRNIPLPFGSIHNKRSFVALDNLVDFIVTCIDHPAAANEVFLISDGEDVSTTEFLNKISSALGKQSRLFAVNKKNLEFALNIIGKNDLTQQLCGSLQVDIRKAKRLLNWTPPVSVDVALRKMAENFLSHNTNE